MQVRPAPVRHVNEECLEVVDDGRYNLEVPQDAPKTDEDDLVHRGRLRGLRHYAARSVQNRVRVLRLEGPRRGFGGMLDIVGRQSRMTEKDGDGRRDEGEDECGK